MTQKMIAIDLDGTTLNDQHELTPTTIDVLQQVAALGHKIVIVTGRPFRNSKEIYEQIGVGGPIVNFNGGYCHHPQDENWEYTYKKLVPNHVAKKIAELFPSLEKATVLMAETNRLVYSTLLEIPDKTYFPEGTEIVPLTPEDLGKEKINCLTLFSDKKDQAELRHLLLKAFPDEIDVRTWGGTFPCLEIVAKQVEKSVGVKHLAQVWNISQENILAFGDEDNDREMLSFAGLGVAMKNAIDDLKQLADDVTPLTNDENGLAEYLKEYFQLS